MGTSRPSRCPGTQRPYAAGKYRPGTIKHRRPAGTETCISIIHEKRAHDINIRGVVVLGALEGHAHGRAILLNRHDAPPADVEAGLDSLELGLAHGAVGRVVQQVEALKTWRILRFTWRATAQNKTGGNGGDAHNATTCHRRHGRTFTAVYTATQPRVAYPYRQNQLERNRENEFASLP